MEDRVLALLSFSSHIWFPTPSSCLEYLSLLVVAMASEQKLPTVASVERFRGNAETDDVDDYTEEAITVPAKYRGTAADKKDMLVLGKKQVLRVSALHDSFNHVNHEIAEFQIRHHARIC